MTPPSDASRRARALSVVAERVTPIGKLVPSEHPWMTSPATQKIMAALNVGGVETRFVGGCVRDALLKRAAYDVDLATTTTPEDVIARLAEVEIHTIPTGIEHGTVTAVTAEGDYQITTLRQDVETDGRHARVAFTSDWTADAARRDFTINTLSANMAGDVFDPFQGIAHLAHGIIRFVGKPLDRIDEDVLRIMRFYRMYAYFGSPPVDKEAFAACRLRAPRLVELSGERLSEEFRKILLCRDPAGICTLMGGERAFSHILPEARSDVGRLRTLQWLEQDAIRFDSVRPESLRRLAALVRADAAGVAAIVARFKLSNQEASRLHDVVTTDWQPSFETGEVEMMRALRRMPREVVRDIVLIEWATQLSLQPRRRTAETEGWQRVLAYIDDWQAVEFPLRGQDVLDLGIAPGPDVSTLLERVENWWEDGGYAADREACLSRLKHELSRI